MTNTIKAVRAELQLPGKTVDGYMMPDGEIRVGKAGASIALGYGKEWLGRLHKVAPKKLKSLQEADFTGCTKLVEIHDTGARGGTRAETISISDFTRLITVEALNMNKDAIALGMAFMQVGIEETFSRLFRGQEVDPFMKAYVIYSSWTYEELEEVMAYNRLELKALYN